MPLNCSLARGGVPLYKTSLGSQETEGEILAGGPARSRQAALNHSLSKSPAHNSGKKFDYFYNPKINKRGQFFRAVLKDALDSDHRNWTGGEMSHLRLVAQTGTMVIGSGSMVFTCFGSLRMNTFGQVAFVADVLAPGSDVDPGSTLCGIWALAANGTLTKVVLAGESVTVSPGETRLPRS